MKSSAVDHGIFLPSIIFIVLISAGLAIFNDSVTPVLSWIMNAVNTRLDWVFEFLTFGVFIYLMYIAFSQKGKILLGEEAKPQFGDFSYGAMLFCAGMGTSIMFWSIIEPMYYLQYPPFQIEGNSKQAAEWALTYGLFHWGVSAWAIYILPTVVIAYSLYNRKTHSLKISQVCKDVLGRYADGWVGKVIDILVIWSLVGGLGTSLGLGVPMMSAGIGDLLGLEHSTTLDIMIILIWSVIYLASAVLGLDKGIRILSNINVYLAIALAVFVLAVGPTSFIFSYFTDSFGLMAQNFIRMSFYTDPIYQSQFPQSWTVFYWVWFACTAPFLGLFVARISKGRTLQNVILHMLLWGSLGGWLYFAVFGGYTIHLQLNDILDVAKSMKDVGNPSTVIAVIKSLPFGDIAVVVFIILGFIFLATSLDSASYVLASISSKDDAVDKDPQGWLIIVWGLIMSVLAISLLLVGGLKVVQSSTVAAGVPILIIYLLLLASLHKWLKGSEVRENS